MSIRGPLFAGTILSFGAVAAAARFDPGPVAFPRLSARHLAASYMALASAPFGNGLELFALVAFIYFACFLAAGLWRVRHGPPL
jgi:hypothetical protein